MQLNEDNEAAIPHAQVTRSPLIPQSTFPAPNQPPVCPAERTGDAFPIPPRPTSRTEQNSHFRRFQAPKPNFRRRLPLLSRGSFLKDVFLLTGKTRRYARHTLTPKEPSFSPAACERRLHARCTLTTRERARPVTVRNNSNMSCD